MELFKLKSLYVFILLNVNLLPIPVVENIAISLFGLFDVAIHPHVTLSLVSTGNVNSIQNLLLSPNDSARLY